MVVSVSDPAVQITRLRERDTHLSEEDAQNRVSSQRDVREKARQALARGEGRGVVVLNDGDREDLKKEIRRVMGEVEKGSPQWWAYLCLVVPPVGVMAAAWTVWNNWRAQVAWAETMKREKAKL
jgi:dephospho-CoA kinase